MIPSSSINAFTISDTEELTKSENSGCCSFSSSNSSKGQPAENYSHQQMNESYFKHSKHILENMTAGGRSKSSSFSNAKNDQVSTFEIDSLASKTINSSSHIDRNVLPTNKNHEFNRRSSFSSNRFEGETACKNSIVITNSRFLPDTNQNQTLSGISFNDKISFALPPKLTLEELNERSIREDEVLHLLKITRDMNSQLKKRKKRNKRTKELNVIQQRPLNSQLFKNQAVDRNLVNFKPDIRKSDTYNDFKNKKCFPEMIEDSKIVQTRVSVQNERSNESNRIPPERLLQLRSQNISPNPIIIQSLRRLRLLKPSTSSVLKCSTEKYRRCKESNKQNDSKYSLFNSLKFQDCSTDEMNKSNNKFQPLQIPPLMEIKPLMQKSWFAIEDNEEEKNSKEIYQHLLHLVQNFDNDSQEPRNNEKTLEDKVKKKKNKKKSCDNTESSDQKNPIADLVKLNFEDHYDESRINAGLENCTLFKEIIRINQKNYREAYLFNPNERRDIFIDGVHDRNRALEGDEVVVELYPEEKWKVFPDESVQKCGKVVAISKRNHPLIAVGYLKIVHKKGKIRGIALWPRDSRLPRVKIPIESCPSNLKIDLKHNERMLYEAKICKWDVVNLAEGILIRELGEQNDIEVETKCILLETHLNVEPFENVDEHLPSIVDVINESDLKIRMDLRNQCIFTIDPLGAKDLDDALSCQELPNGNFEVGIHIADVSHYLLPDTQLDLDAREKATSVYLTQKVFHMLPNKLCETCSLTPSKDKLAFSLLVELNENAEIIKHNFSKTAIRSCAQFTYQHAQMMIDQSLVDCDNFPLISNGFTREDCVKAITNLYFLARKIRKRRFDEGALRIDQPKIVFSLDENSFPKSYSLDILKESNWLIEEYMLLANILTANILREKFPELALLRKHSSPNETALTVVVESLEKIGIYIDTSTAGSIYHSMMKYDGVDEIGMARMAVILNLLVKPMVRASYVCSTVESEADTAFRHYALNVPFYTHFTSPIRRYADVVVHRTLASSLGYCELPKWTPEDIQLIAVNCNKKKNSAKKAGELSTELFLKLYMEKYGPIKVRAVVIEVKERHFDVIDLSTRTINRVFVDKIKSSNVTFENTQGMASLNVTWKNDDEMEIRQIIQIFTIIDVLMAYNKLVNKVTVSLLRPSS